MLQTLPQEYIDFTDLDGDTAATLAIQCKNDKLAKMIVEKTSVNSLFSGNHEGASAIYLACWLNKFDLVKIIIEKYNNDLSDQEQKLIWNDNRDLHSILKYLVNTAIEQEESYNFLEKAVKNLFDCYSNIVFLKSDFATDNEYEEKLNAFNKNKELFSGIIEHLTLTNQSEEFINDDSHQDQIN